MAESEGSPRDLHGVRSRIPGADFYWTAQGLLDGRSVMLRNYKQQAMIL